MHINTKRTLYNGIKSIANVIRGMSLLLIIIFTALAISQYGFHTTRIIGCITLSMISVTLVLYCILIWLDRNMAIEARV